MACEKPAQCPEAKFSSCFSSNTSVALSLSYFCGLGMLCVYFCIKTLSAFLGLEGGDEEHKRQTQGQLQGLTRTPASSDHLLPSRKPFLTQEPHTVPTQVPSWPRVVLSMFV